MWPLISAILLHRDFDIVNSRSSFSIIFKILACISPPNTISCMSSESYCAHENMSWLSRSWKSWSSASRRDLSAFVLSTRGRSFTTRKTIHYRWFQKPSFIHEPSHITLPSHSTELSTAWFDLGVVITPVTCYFSGLILKSKFIYKSSGAASARRDSSGRRLPSGLALMCNKPQVSINIFLIDFRLAALRFTRGLQCLKGKNEVPAYLKVHLGSSGDIAKWVVVWDTWALSCDRHRSFVPRCCFISRCIFSRPQQ